MSNDPSTEKSFNGLQAIVWPVHSWENKKFLPMSFMCMLTIYVYSILRATKDAVIVPILGAEMISAVKIWGVLPSAIIFMVAYSKLTNLFNREKLFYIILSFFVGFFLLYSYVLSPNHEYFMWDLSSVVDAAPNFKYPLIMLSHWTHSLFYIMSELWGSVMLSLLFWQFANEIVKVKEAKRFYSLFGLLGQVGMIVAGYVGATLAEMTIGIEDAWRLTLNYVTISVTIAGILLAVIYWWMNKFVLTDKKYYDPEESASKGKKKKVKLSVIEGFKYIFSSKYLGLIALLVISYGISINLVEGVWKKQLQIQYPNQNDYSLFMGHFQIWTGFGTIIGMMIGVNVLRRFSWTFSALITPVVILVTGALFFIFIIFRDSAGAMLAAFGMSALMMAVITGAAQNIFSKAIKYSLFDSTKEMSYIPLDPELKSKGKAAVDVVGARLGKSGGAIIQQVLLSMFVGSSLETFTNELFIMFIVIMIIWLYAVIGLGKEFEKQNKS